MKWEKTINPVRSIGPSKAHDLLFGCPLSVVIGSKSNRENCPESIPSNRKAIIGTIKHGLQERAISSRWEEEVGEWTLEEAISIFEDLTEKEEEKLKNLKQIF